MKIYYVSIRHYDGENEVFPMCADYPTEAKRIKLDCILKIRR